MKRRNRLYPFHKALTEAQKEERRNNFADNYEIIAERLQELSRILWARNFINSLLLQMTEKGYLTDKQLEKVTEMYIDSCAWSDEKIREQQSARKLLYRLCECRTGRNLGFISSLLNKSDYYPLSPRQLSSLFKIANRFRVQLEEIPDIDNDCWDGWVINREKWREKIRASRQNNVDS